MINKWLVIAGILVLLLGTIGPLMSIFMQGGSYSSEVLTSFIIGLVIIYLGLYGIPKR